MADEPFFGRTSQDYPGGLHVEIQNFSEVSPAVCTKHQDSAPLLQQMILFSWRHTRCARRGGALCVRCLSDRETERVQAKEMQLNEYTAFLSSVKKNKIEANPIYGCWCWFCGALHWNYWRPHTFQRLYVMMEQQRFTVCPYFSNPIARVKCGTYFMEWGMTLSTLKLILKPVLYAYGKWTCISTTPF